MDEMREAFEEWRKERENAGWLTQVASDLPAFRAGAEWQAAQTVSVPSQLAEQIHCYRANYDLNAWGKITNGFSDPVAPAGAILAVNALCDMVEGLQAELEALRKDAERYKWLRNHKLFNYAVHKAAEIGGTGLDAAIDAAIAGEKA